jgi:Abhydrolase family
VLVRPQVIDQATRLPKGEIREPALRNAQVMAASATPWPGMNPFGPQARHQVRTSWELSMTTRRDFVHGLALALGGLPAATGTARAVPLLADDPPVPGPGRAPAEPTGSDVGSLFPFIKSQAVRGEFPLSFLRDEFRDPTAWKRRARGKLKELLHYDPPACDPKPEVVAKVDRDGYVRETVSFNTTPDVRVPAVVLVPKGLKKPAPGIVALHDHGGMYFWGREKVAEVDGEHPVLAEFKRGAYGGKSIASELARRGYVVIVIDMFYWGERRMVLDADPADWRERPATITSARVAEFNRRASESESLVGRTIYSAGFTWSGVMLAGRVAESYLTSISRIRR